MIKKLVVTTLGVLLVGGLLLHSPIGSYVTTTYSRMTDSVSANVPLEFQIDRARNMVRELEPEIRRSMHVIAKEEVAVEQLNERLESTTNKAAKDKSDILRLQSDLQTGEAVFRYAGRTYSDADVREDLSRRFTRFKTTDSTLASLEQMRDARQRNLDAAREKLTAMMSAQSQLQVEVENLEAKLKLVEVAQASSDFQFDTSKLSRAKQLMTDIQARLDVAAKLANADTHFQEAIPLESGDSSDISEQVAAYFQQDAVAHTSPVAIELQD